MSQQPHETSTKEEDLDQITFEEHEEYEADYAERQLPGDAEQQTAALHQEYKNMINDNLRFALEKEPMLTSTSIRVPGVIHTIFSPTPTLISTPTNYNPGFPFARSTQANKARKKDEGENDDTYKGTPPSSPTHK